MIRARYAAFILALTLMLGACSMIQTPVPKTFNQADAYALTLIRSVNSTAAQAYKSQYLTQAQGRAVNKQLRLAMDTRSTARDIRSTNPEDAAANLEFAIKILEKIQIELEAKQ